jgi:dynein heavy chain
VELFGLHPNASFPKQMRQSQELISALQSSYLQGFRGTLLADDSTAEDGFHTCNGMEQDLTFIAKENDIVLRTASWVRTTMPPLIDETASACQPRSNAEKKSPIYLQLLQELEAVSSLLQIVSTSLTKLEGALLGQVPMSASNEQIWSSLLNNKPCAAWSQGVEPKRSLSSWVNDVLIRTSFFRTWFTSRENPKCFLIPAFGNPQGFLSAVLQLSARRAKIPVDDFEFCHDILSKVEEPGDVQEHPRDGVLVFGIWIESARWDVAADELMDAAVNEPLTQLPVIHFVPVTNYHVDHGQICRAPFYRTLARAGVISTSGQCLNFIAAVDLPSSSSEQWILRGVALFCHLDD